MREVAEMVSVVMVFLWLSGALTIFAQRIGSKGGNKELLEQIGKLQDEIKHLRRENHDLLLSFDDTLRRTERRLDHLEASRMPPSGVSSVSEPEVQRLTLGR